MTTIHPATLLDIHSTLTAQFEELGEASKLIERSELEYATTKADMEIGMAKAFLGIDADRKITVAEREALVRTECAGLIRAHYVATAKSTAAKKNFDRLRIQIDITRSQGSIVRTEMEMT